jgi:integrase
MIVASVHKRIHRGVVSYRAVWKERGPGNMSRQRNKSFTKASDAKAFAARMAQEVERPGVGDPQRYTVAQYLGHWLSGLRDRGELSPTTLECYGHFVAMACREIGHMPLTQLTPAHLDRAYGRLRKQGSKTSGPLSARSVFNVHRVLHTAFEQARKWKLIAENPARDANAPSPERSRARAFTADEMQRLLQEAEQDAETYTAIATIITCGLRRSELLGLAADAIDFDTNTLTVRRTVVAVNYHPVLRDTAKSESSLRTLAIPAQLAALLRAQLTRVRENMLAWGREYQREPLLIFPGIAGTPIIPQSLTTKLRKVMQRESPLRCC